VRKSKANDGTDIIKAGDSELEVKPNGLATFREYLKSGDVVTKTTTTGYVDLSSQTGGPVAGYTFQVIPNRSERTVQVYGLQGLVSTERLYHTGSGFTHAYTDTEHCSDTASWTVRDGVTIHRSERVAPYTVVETDAEGRQTTTVTDGLGEVLTVTVGGGGGVPPQTTTYVYNGRTTTVTAGGQLLPASTVDGLGRTVSQTDQLGVQTTTVYPNGGRIVTSTAANGISRTQEMHLDGRPKLTFGDDTIRTSYSYDVEQYVDQDGHIRDYELITRRMGPDDGTAGRWTTSTYDDGKLIRETSPSPDPQYAEIVKKYSYNGLDKNQLEAVDAYGDTELVSTWRRAPYDSAVSPAIASMDADVVSGLDLDQDGSLSLGGLEGDRVSRDEWSYEIWNGVPCRVTRRHLYPQGSDTAGLTTITRQTLGFVTVGNGYSEVSQVEQPSGRSTTTTRTVDPSSATVVETMDDSATTGIDKTAAKVNSYVQSVAKAGAEAGKAESYAYDAFGRVERFTDIRGASTWSFFYNDSFQLEKVTNHLGQTTSYQYYPATHRNAGKLHITTLPGGRTTETSYNTRGQMTDITGTGTYHLTYGYNGYGDRNSLTTYRAGSESDVTQWYYNPATGLLEQKIFADNKHVDYTYTWDGKPATRTSARNVVTTWAYEPLSRDLTHIDYTGDGNLTPDITFSGHDQLGRPAQVAENLNGVIRNQALSYQPSSGAVSVTYAADHPWLAGVSVAQTADDLFGRPTGFAVNNSASTVSSQAYTYDALSRLYTVSSADFSAEMTYWPGTETFHTLTVRDVQNSNQLALQRVQSIDMLGRVLGMVNRAPGSGAGSALATVSSVGHTYDAAGRRGDAKREDGTWWDYSYNNRSEVEGAIKKTSTDALVPGLSFGYQYDGIGNRTSATFGTAPNVSTLSYTPNNLNQYSQLTHPGTFDILTRANDAIAATADQATVQATTTEGNLQSTRLAAANSATGKLVTTTLSLNGTSSAVKTWVPKASVTPTYDNDGNLTNDGRWSYIWDGENRLVGMTPITANRAPNVALEFAYDYMGRRIGKKVVDNTQGSTKLLIVSYAYDHWNPVAEWHASTEGGTTTDTLRTHLWGLDLSSPANPPPGTAGFQSAGGVGGLVASSWHNGSTHEHFLPGYDANGNIISWTKPDGTILQRTDYDPFGNPVFAEKLASAAELAHLPDYGFSTKPRDTESGLLYYGFRYYDPATGRWPSRDPIEEVGGLSLYGFVGNDGVNKPDFLGMWANLKRDGKAWAKICAEDDDSWDGLAKLVKLESADVSKWVKNYESEPQEGKAYLVPNVSVFYSTSSWDDENFMIYRITNNLLRDESEDLDRGFKCIPINSDDPEAFKSKWQQDGLYRFHFAGHGAPRTLSHWYGDEIVGWLGLIIDQQGSQGSQGRKRAINAVVASNEVFPNFKPQLVVLYACGSASMDWQNHVSKNGGLFIGYRGLTNVLNDKSQLVIEQY
ncbi:MAG: RHS repeat-associated core domain-containing protein, partial [Luteolibacter sp.]